MPWKKINIYSSSHYKLDNFNPLIGVPVPIGDLWIGLHRLDQLGHPDQTLVLGRTILRFGLETYCREILECSEGWDLQSPAGTWTLKRSTDGQPGCRRAPWSRCWKWWPWRQGVPTASTLPWTGFRTRRSRFGLCLADTIRTALPKRVGPSGSRCSWTTRQWSNRSRWSPAWKRSQRADQKIFQSPAWNKKVINFSLSGGSYNIGKCPIYLIE